MAMGDLNGNRVFINPAMFLNNPDVAWNSATFLHELIDNVTGKLDTTLQGNLFGLGGVNPFNTANITQKIKDDCFKN